MSSKTDTMERKLWVAANLKRARTQPVDGKPLSQHFAAQDIAGPTLQGASVMRWERGKEFPSPRYLPAVVEWIARRLAVEAPR